MSSPACTLSIVCPAFEEAEVLPRFHAELAKVLSTLQPEYDIEIIYIDDGSRDGTLAVLHQLAAADPRVRYLSLSRNFGQQVALTAGLEHSRGDVVISMDSDLQHPPTLIPALLQKYHEGYDVVLTLRDEDPRLSVFKRLSSRVFYQLMRWVSETEIRAAVSDFRLLSRKAVDGLLQLQETHRFMRGLVNWVGFRTTLVSFAPACRGGGATKYTVRRMLALAFDGMLSFSKVPLRLSLFLGLAIILLGLGQGTWAILQALFSSATALGLHLALTSLYLLGGCILCSVGIVGEYVGRIYEQVKGRPMYLLRDSSRHYSSAQRDLDHPPRKVIRPRPPEESSAA
jgi:dolichol-phosphate mannosyltransferase